VSTDLATRLRDRLDQVEAVAKAAAHPDSWWTVGDAPDDDWDVFEMFSDPGSPGRCEDDGHKPNRCDDMLVATADEDFGQRPGEVARHIAMHDPASVLRQVAASRKMLELHKAFEIPKYEYTGNPTIKIDANGREIRYWPPGSITGKRQVGASYRCEHCETRDDSFREYPCPTLQALAEMWGVSA
jgi:uncharacterized protein DUF6221